LDIAESYFFQSLAADRLPRVRVVEHSVITACGLLEIGSKLS
jgi:hypothetical protein